jgi:lysyl-tRNA synthetase class 1
MAKRVLELSQLINPLEGLEGEMPFQPSFRHLTNVLQIHDGNIAKAKEYYTDDIKNARDERRFNERAQCALNWLEKFAPEDFKFNINSETPKVELDDKSRSFLQGLNQLLSEKGSTFTDDQQLHEAIYEIMHGQELKPGDIFPLCYNILISKPKGPKLAGFMRTIGLERVNNLIKGAL